MMKEQLLKLLSRNAALSIDDMATRLNTTSDAVRQALAELTADRAIAGYKAIIADDRIDNHEVQALIEVKVTPRRDGGFDQTAKRIARFAEVTDLCLVSGGFDLLVTVRGESLREVAAFVSEKLATIDGVLSTATSFQLKKYKESGRLLEMDEHYERLQVCP